MASRETMRVKVGQGLFSKTTIHSAKSSACRKTKCIEPAKAVIRSAIRSWTSDARFSNCATTVG